MSGFEITRTTLTSCPTDSAQHFSIVPQVFCRAALAAQTRPAPDVALPLDKGGEGAGTCLSGGGGGGRGSKGGGEGVQGGGGPPPRRNVPSPQGTENLLGNEPLSTWKCHLVGSKQSQFIIAGQFRVPSSNQDTTNTTKRTFTISCQLTVIMVNQN